MTRDVVAWAYLAGLLVCAGVTAGCGAACVLYVRRIYRLNERLGRRVEGHLDLTAAHGALSDARAVELTAQISRNADDIPTRTATKVLEVMAESVGVPRPNGAANAVVPALAFGLAVMMSAATAGPTERPTRAPEATVTGQTALREGLYSVAEKVFDAAGDDLGRAEALVCQGRHADAERLLEHDETGPGLRIRALAARGRGDRAAFANLIRQAAALDDRVACRLVATHAVGG